MSITESHDTPRDYTEADAETLEHIARCYGDNHALGELAQSILAGRGE